jgi:hypothetical protein
MLLGDNVLNMVVQLAEFLRQTAILTAVVSAPPNELPLPDIQHDFSFDSISGGAWF